jgi:hypothetical protein
MIGPLMSDDESTSGCGWFMNVNLFGFSEGQSTEFIKVL